MRVENCESRFMPSVPLRVRSINGIKLLLAPAVVVAVWKASGVDCLGLFEFWHELCTRIAHD